MTPLPLTRPGRMTLASRANSRRRAGFVVHPLVNLALSGLAVALAAAAMIVALTRSGETGKSPAGLTAVFPGKGLAGYDFSTPAKALESGLRIRAEGDVAAMIERDIARARLEQDKALERLNSLKLDRTMEADGKSVVLYSIRDDDGETRYGAEWFEKKADGRFYATFVNTYPWRDEAGEKGQARKALDDWEARNQPSRTDQPRIPLP